MTIRIIFFFKTHSNRRIWIIDQPPRLFGKHNFNEVSKSFEPHAPPPSWMYTKWSTLSSAISFNPFSDPHQNLQIIISIWLQIFIGIRKQLFIGIAWANSSYSGQHSYKHISSYLYKLPLHAFYSLELVVLESHSAFACLFYMLLI